MDSVAVSSPPLATRPPTHPTQMLTRTRTSFFSGVPDGGRARGFDGSIGAAGVLFEREPKTEPKSTTPYLWRLYPTRPRPMMKIRVQPPFSIFTAIVFVLGRPATEP